MKRGSINYFLTDRKISKPLLSLVFHPITNAQSLNGSPYVFDYGATLMTEANNGYQALTKLFL